MPGAPRAWGVSGAQVADGSYRASASFRAIKARVEREAVALL